MCILPMAASFLSLSGEDQMQTKPRIVVGPDGRIALVNEHAQRLLGFTEQELIGASSESLLHEDVRAAHVRARDAFLAEPSYGGEPLAPGMSPLLTSSGRSVFAWLVPQPLVGDGGLWLSLTLNEANA